MREEDSPMAAILAANKHKPFVLRHKNGKYIIYHADWRYGEVLKKTANIDKATKFTHNTFQLTTFCRVHKAIAKRCTEIDIDTAYSM